MEWVIGNNNNFNSYLKKLDNFRTYYVKAVFVTQTFRRLKPEKKY